MIKIEERSLLFTNYQRWEQFTFTGTCLIGPRGFLEDMGRLQLNLS